MKVILSTLGPLHLIKSAEYLSKLVDIRVIQGMLPSWWNRWMIGLASKIQHRDISKTIKKRTPDCLNGRNVGLTIPDVYYWACRMFRIATPQHASMKSAALFGRLQKRYLRNADIYHVRSGSGAEGAIKVAKDRGMKVVVDHSIAHPAFMDANLKSEFQKNNATFTLGLDNPFWREIVNECEQADILLVNSNFVKDTFVCQGYDENKIRVAYLGVRQDFFSLKTDYSADQKLRILFTGGFGFRKGAEYILLALCELDKLGIPYEATIVGNASEAQSLLKRITPLHINLVNTVPQSELKTFLANSDVYLFPSLCEGCASSGMEAMAAGLPVIATAESGLPITNGKNGIIVDARCVKQIVDALLRLQESEQLRRQLGQAAAQLIRDNYTWEKYAENVAHIYEELIH